MGLRSSKRKKQKSNMSPNYGPNSYYPPPQGPSNYPPPQGPSNYPPPSRNPPPNYGPNSYGPPDSYGPNSFGPSDSYGPNPYRSPNSYGPYGAPPDVPPFHHRNIPPGSQVICVAIPPPKPLPPIVYTAPSVPPPRQYKKIHVCKDLIY